MLRFASSRTCRLCLAVLALALSLSRLPAQDPAMETPPAETVTPPPASEEAPAPAAAATEPPKISPDDATQDGEVVAESATPQTLRGELGELPVQLDPKVKIGKIYDFLNDPAKTKTGGNQSIEYEFKYLNHGAVTNEQQARRLGHYFVVNWSNGGEAGDLVLRMDYRQSKSRDKIHTIEIPFTAARGSRKGKFAIIGDAYHELGQVYSWRISVVRNGTILAEKKSFVW